MIEEMLDKLVDEKMDYKEYKEIADEMEEPRYKEMFDMIAEQEHTHYKMIREYLEEVMQK